MNFSISKLEEDLKKCQRYLGEVGMGDSERKDNVAGSELTKSERDEMIRRLLKERNIQLESGLEPDSASTKDTLRSVLQQTKSPRSTSCNDVEGAYLVGDEPRDLYRQCIGIGGRRYTEEEVRMHAQDRMKHDHSRVRQGGHQERGLRRGEATNVHIAHTNSLRQEQSTEAEKSQRKLSKTDEDKLIQKLDVWSKSYKSKLESLQRLKEQKEKAEDEKHSFRPQVRKKRKSTAKSKCSTRLYEDAMRRITVRERQKEILKKTEDINLSFRPVINKKSERLRDRPPIFERVADIQHDLSKKLQRLSVETHKNDMDESFRPLINKRSKSIATKQSNIMKRFALHKDETARSKMVSHIDICSENECSFVPSINAKSKEIMKRSSTQKGVAQDFLTRQTLLQKQKSSQDSQINGEIESSDGVTFVPNTGNSGEILKKSRKYKHIYRKYDGTEQSKDEIFERLSYTPAVQTDNGQITGRADATCTFKPQLSKRTQQLSRRRSLTDLTRVSDQIAVQRESREKQELEFHASHPFQPSLQAKAITKGKKREFNPITILDEIEDDRQQKMEKLQKQRDILVERELNECSFNPKINKKSKISARNVTVAGFQEHVDARTEFLKRQQELKEHEEKVARGGNYKCNPLRPYTIPKPFALSFEDQPKKILLEEDLEFKFHPVTTQSLNRKLIAELLDDRTDQYNI
eukprot:229415_1